MRRCDRRYRKLASTVFCSSTKPPRGADLNRHSPDPRLYVGNAFRRFQSFVATVIERTGSGQIRSRGSGSCGRAGWHGGHTQSELELLRDGESVTDLDPEIAHRALELRVSKQKLNRPEVFSVNTGYSRRKFISFNRRH